MSKCPICADPAIRLSHWTYYTLAGIHTCFQHASPLFQSAQRQAAGKRDEAILRAKLVYEGEMVDICRLERRNTPDLAETGRSHEEGKT